MKNISRALLLFATVILVNGMARLDGTQLSPPPQGLAQHDGGPNPPPPPPPQKPPAYLDGSSPIPLPTIPPARLDGTQPYPPPHIPPAHLDGAGQALNGWERQTK